MNYSKAMQNDQNLSQGQERRSGQVSNEMERGAQMVQRIETYVSELHTRLEPILQSKPIGSDKPPASSPRPSLVGHATALQNHNDQLERIADELQWICSGIEL